MKSTHSSATWLNDAVNQTGIAEIVKDAVTKLREVEFDTVAFRGMSGALIAPIVAYKLKKEIALIRKPDGASHSYYRYEGFQQSQRYVIIDDFVSTGDTVKEIVRGMRQYNSHPKFAGLYLYHSNGDMKRDFYPVDSNIVAASDLFEKIKSCVGGTEL